MKKVGIFLIGVLAVIGISLGGWKIKETVEQQGIIKIVNSNDVKNIIEDNLKIYDKNALTKKGIIKTYMIDDTTIKRSPMGGILFDIYINNNHELLMHFTLEKDKGVLKQSGGGYSKEFSKFIKESISNNG
ncbi:DUF1310 family protein [Streptococcus loxodontisalivarius]|uniref:DUF1310 family protein n=1 Tax=Streptococcus loxodontisalivarius TaxID=1349415 RepID=A0ABS2PRT3_9STRE|nr:DUF1310 family protein [Streptococcus loxodontisalivarius]MBM7642753.1 hypothetical protein [Streptococcus loxodontisalivarius]